MKEKIPAEEWSELRRLCNLGDEGARDRLVGACMRMGRKYRIDGMELAHAVLLELAEEIERELGRTDPEDRP